MKIACIILAHQHPGQLLRLVKSLRHTAFDCWIHLDGKCSLTDFKEVWQEKNVHLVTPRLSVSWGNFNIVQAMINSLTAVVNADTTYDYFHFISGMDYPIKPLQLFYDHLIENAGTEFIGNRPYEENQQNISRFKSYHFNNLHSPLRNIAERLTNTFLPKRKFPFPFQIRKGPQWITLSKEAVSYLLDFISKSPSYIRYFKYVHAPDEFFFQTILYNSPFKEKLKDHIFQYVDWHGQQKSPKTLTIVDKEKIWGSPLFFARKFDEQMDAAILDALDEKIGNSE